MAKDRLTVDGVEMDGSFSIKLTNSDSDPYGAGVEPIDLAHGDDFEATLIMDEVDGAKLARASGLVEVDWVKTHYPPGRRAVWGGRDHLLAKLCWQIGSNTLRRLNRMHVLPARTAATMACWLDDHRVTSDIQIGGRGDSCVVSVNFPRVRWGTEEDL